MYDYGWDTNYEYDDFDLDDYEYQQDSCLPEEFYREEDDAWMWEEDETEIDVDLGHCVITWVSTPMTPAS